MEKACNSPTSKDKAIARRKAVFIESHLTPIMSSGSKGTGIDLGVIPGTTDVNSFHLFA